MSKKEFTQMDVLKEFYIENPNRDIPHKEVVDWSVEKWRELTGDVFRDPDRGIRSLYEKGFLTKVKKGVYKYDPNSVVDNKLEDFTENKK